MDNIDNEIFRIFSALDVKNQGFMDKNDFLDKLLNHFSSSDEIDEKDKKKLENIVKRYSKIGLEEFKKIYMDIQKLRDNDIVTLDKDSFNNFHESSYSSGSSDIDEYPDKRKFRLKENILSISPPNSSESVRSDSFLSSPSSASRNAKELLHSSRASLQKIISGPLLVESTNMDFNNKNEKNDSSQKEIEEIYDNNRKMKEEIYHLNNLLKDEERRYQMEKDQCKAGSAKIYLLESMNHELEIGHKDEIKKINEKYNTKLQSMEAFLEETQEDFKMKYSEIEKKLAKTCKENDDLIVHCQQLTDENDDLLRKGQHLQALNHDTEAVLMEYKKVASRQVTELQTERDQLEMVNRQLYSELQTIKHLTASNQSSSEPVLFERPRTRSEFQVNNETKRLSLEAVKKESSASKVQLNTIESESNRLVHSLTMENRNLVERIAHLETVTFYQREKLEAANCLSLADEMEQLNFDELKKALTIERETAKTLHSYLETLTNKLLLAGNIDVFHQS